MNKPSTYKGKYIANLNIRDRSAQEEYRDLTQNPTSQELENDITEIMLWYVLCSDRAEVLRKKLAESKDINRTLREEGTEDIPVGNVLTGLRQAYFLGILHGKHGTRIKR